MEVIPIDADALLNGIELEHCSDAALLEAWRDAVHTPPALADAIIAELDFRRALRAASVFEYPPTPDVS